MCPLLVTGNWPDMAAGKRAEEIEVPYEPRTRPAEAALSGGVNRSSAEHVGP